MDVWELMSQECRDEVVLIDSSCLLETLETYLRKHRYVKRTKTHAFILRNTCCVFMLIEIRVESMQHLKVCRVLLTPF